jgi:hypothetical protein
LRIGEFFGAARGPTGSPCVSPNLTKMESNSLGINRSTQHSSAVYLPES